MKNGCGDVGREIDRLLFGLWGLGGLEYVHCKCNIRIEFYHVWELLIASLATLSFSLDQSTSSLSTIGPWVVVIVICQIMPYCCYMRSEQGSALHLPDSAQAEHYQRRTYLPHLQPPSSESTFCASCHHFRRHYHYHYRVLLKAKSSKK